MVSATTYTLVGVVNKFLTVLLNVVLWDKHSSPVGLFAVCLCLLAGMFYEQAPRREDVRKQKLATQETEMTDRDSSNRLLKTETSAWVPDCSHIKIAVTYRLQEDS